MASSSSSKFLSCLLLITVHFVTLTFAQLPSFLYSICSDKGNYTINSTYQTNLKLVLSNFSTTTQFQSGFYNLSHGQNSDQVNGLALCRGDATSDICLTCLKTATEKLLQDCPNQKEAIEWYDYCMLRYSNRTIYGVAETNPTVYLWNTGNATNANLFNTQLGWLMNSLISEAAEGGSLKKFATGQTSYTDFSNIFGLVQCTPDLTQQQCINCLQEAAAQIPVCCDGKQGGRVLKPSCNLRYEVYVFYENSPSPPPPPSPNAPPPSRLISPAPPTNATEEKSSIKARNVIIIVVTTVISVIILMLILFYFRRKTYKKIVGNGEDISTGSSLQYDLVIVRIATNDFADGNKLGEGGFGPVYKGRLSNGTEIAVKRLAKNSGQGEIEFKNEVVLVAKLQHRNLVRLLGFCLEGEEYLLIYEFVPNTSLDKYIFDPMKRTCLDWERRYKIIVGIARGILYLHEDSRLRIVHRDLKASNVLLDSEMNAKISDFGLARLFRIDQTQGATNRIVGTYGYMAPEYAMHGQFSVKSDVFSFGVLVLEIICGQKNSCFRSGEDVGDLLSYAWKNWKEGKASSLIDPTLTTGSRNDIMRCIHIGLLCAQENVVERPTMASVVLMLSSNSISLPVPSRPPFFMHSGVDSDVFFLDDDSSSVPLDKSKSKSEKWSVNEVSITELDPR